LGSFFFKKGLSPTHGWQGPIFVIFWNSHIFLNFFKKYKNEKKALFQADSFSLFQNQVQQKIVVRSGPARIENWTGTAFPAPNRPGLHPHLPSPYLRNDSAAACEVRLGGGREAELAAREAAVRGGGLAHLPRRLPSSAAATTTISLRRRRSLPPSRW